MADAEAITEVARRPAVRFVAVKSAERSKQCRSYHRNDGGQM
jgi:hypothetical protein